MENRFLTRLCHICKIMWAFSQCFQINTPFFMLKSILRFVFVVFGAFAKYFNFSPPSGRGVACAGVTQYLVFATSRSDTFSNCSIPFFPALGRGGCAGASPHLASAPSHLAPNPVFWRKKIQFQKRRRGKQVLGSACAPRNFRPPQLRFGKRGRADTAICSFFPRRETLLFAFRQLPPLCK